MMARQQDVRFDDLEYEDPSHETRRFRPTMDGCVYIGLIKVPTIELLGDLGLDHR